MVSSNNLYAAFASAEAAAFASAEAEASASEASAQPKQYFKKALQKLVTEKQVQNNITERFNSDLQEEIVIKYIH